MMGNNGLASLDLAGEPLDQELTNSLSAADNSWAEAIELCLAHLEEKEVPSAPKPFVAASETRPAFPTVSHHISLDNLADDSQVEAFAAKEKPASVSEIEENTEAAPTEANETSVDAVPAATEATSAGQDDAAPPPAGADAVAETSETETNEAAAEAAPPPEAAETPAEETEQTHTGAEETTTEDTPVAQAEEAGESEAGGPEQNLAERMGKAAEDWPKLEDLDLAEFDVVEEPAPEPPAPFAQVKAIETFTPAPESKIPAPKPIGGPAVAELVAARAEIRRLEARCENLEGLHHEASKTLARRQADFDNFRRRVERERDEVRPMLISEVVTPLLPVVDNLERALATQSGLAEGLDADPQHFVQGVELIAQQLVNALSSIGVEAVPAIGELFDPEIHEAVALEATDEYPPNTVTREILRGYKLGERLLRPAMVKVAAAPKPSPAESS